MSNCVNARGDGPPCDHPKESHSALTWQSDTTCTQCHCPKFVSAEELRDLTLESGKISIRYVEALHNHDKETADLCMAELVKHPEPAIFFLSSFFIGSAISAGVDVQRMIDGMIEAANDT